MVWKLMCDCDKRFEVDINSQKLFFQLKKFFESQVKNGIFVEDEKNHFMFGKKVEENKNIMLQSGIDAKNVVAYGNLSILIFQRGDL